MDLKAAASGFLRRSYSTPVMREIRRLPPPTPGDDVWEHRVNPDVQLVASPDTTPHPMCCAPGCGVRCGTHVALRVHSVSSHGSLSDNRVCGWCCRRFKSKSTRDRHMSSIHVGDRFACGWHGCHYIARTKSDLYKHRCGVHGLVVWQCPWGSCCQHLTLKKSLMNHLRKHLGMRWRCDLDGCGRVLSDRAYALTHIVGVHRIPRSLGVDHIVCVNVLFMKEKSRDRIECPDLSSIVRLSHPRVVVGWLPCCADGCEVVCRDMLSLRLHVSRCHGSLLSDGCVCPYCCGVFSRKSHMRVHVSGVHVGVRFPCVFDGCRHAATRKGHLKKHCIARHGVIGGHVCEWVGCGGVFATPSALAIHVSSVHEKKRWLCDWPVSCGKHFSSKGTLTAHIRWHEGLRFRCLCVGRMCRYVCDQKGQMTSHIRGKHGVLRDLVLGVDFERFNYWEEYGDKIGRGAVWFD